MVGRSGAQVDACDLAGHEAASGGVVGELGVGQARLLAESDAGPARVAQRPDEHRGEERRVDLVAHRVGHREVQRVALHREVERVAADVAGGLEPAGERELPGLARVRGRQQAVLDFGGERQRDRALAPLEEVGEPAVGDDDVGEGVRGERDVGHRLLVRRSSRRSSSTPMASPRLVTGANTRVPSALVSTLDRLRRERAAVRASRQRHPLGGLPPLRARGGRAAGVAEPDERLAAEVGDEEGDLARAQRARPGARRGRRRRRTGGASSTAASSAPRSSRADGRFAIGRSLRAASSDTPVRPTGGGPGRAARSLERDAVRHIADASGANGQVRRVCSVSGQVAGAAARCPCDVGATACIRRCPRPPRRRGSGPTPTTRCRSSRSSPCRWSSSA